MKLARKTNKPAQKSSHPGNPAGVPRRKFLQLPAATFGTLGAGVTSSSGDAASAFADSPKPLSGSSSEGRKFNTEYSGAFNNRIAFPMGGMGAGTICLEGTGALSHISLRHKPEVFNEPCVFAAVCVTGKRKIARVLEGPVPTWKLFGGPETGKGLPGRSYGLPRFQKAVFETRFPFGTVKLADKAMPVRVEITGWSPFEPGDPDNASLPVAGLEYKFINLTDAPLEAVFSFNTKNFMALPQTPQYIKPIAGGFVLSCSAPKERSWEEGAFSASVSEPGVKVNHAWFRGGWWDPLTMAWRDIANGASYDRPPISEGGAAPGATLFVPFKLDARAEKTVVLRLAWHVGRTNLRLGKAPAEDTVTEGGGNAYQPWYSRKFSDINAVSAYWRDNYEELRKKSRRFSDCLNESTCPPEVLEAVAANLGILKSPTVLRQADGRFWGWEGCNDTSGCCAGSCTHVWNYAQAIPHLFSSLERTLRETEFGVSQDDRGHQTFRSALPIRPVLHNFHAAADGQLGGIMKVYRDWRISGDTEWLRRLWPKVKSSLEYCINEWDPERKGWLEEPHHNTYDIEFWGPDGMCTSFYLGALKAAVLMAEALKENADAFSDLLAKGLKRMESELYDGEYFLQKIEWKNLRAKSPLEVKSLQAGYSKEAQALLEKEGPKYQYGQGCLADGVLGFWLALVCGVGQVGDPAKVLSHLKAVHKYNFREDLSEHANPQRPGYACGAEGGLLLCTWPKGGEPSLPFVYSNEVWTGIEYQVASHLILMGQVEKGLDIVRACRARYDGRVRNPFNEYECGHWYARAMSSYALLQSLSGARYDAVEQVLYLKPVIKGDFKIFFSTATGYGLTGIRKGKPFLDVVAGDINPREIKLVK